MISASHSCAQLLGFMFVAVIQGENICGENSREQIRPVELANSAQLLSPGSLKKRKYSERFGRKGTLRHFLRTVFMPECPSFHCRMEVFPSEK